MYFNFISRLQSRNWKKPNQKWMGMECSNIVSNLQIQVSDKILLGEFEDRKISGKDNRKF